MGLGGGTSRSNSRARSSGAKYSTQEAYMAPSSRLAPVTNSRALLSPWWPLVLSGITRAAGSITPVLPQPPQPRGPPVRAGAPPPPPPPPPPPRPRRGAERRPPKRRPAVAGIAGEDLV